MDEVIKTKLGEDTLWGSEQTAICFVIQSDSIEW